MPGLRSAVASDKQHVMIHIFFSLYAHNSRQEYTVAITASEKPVAWLSVSSTPLAGVGEAVLVEGPDKGADGGGGAVVDDVVVLQATTGISPVQFMDCHMNSSEKEAA